MTEDAPTRERILIVDDEPQNLRLLESILGKRGYQISAFTRGDAALKAVKEDRPDLVLLDIRMPELDGYEVCARLKADPRLREVPVLFLSALQETWDKVRAFRSGGVDYITRPFQFEEVVARVQTHLQLSRLRRQLADHNLLLEHRIQERTRQLAEANSRLAALGQAKTDFLKIISHELHTPLNGLCGVAELLFLEAPRSEEVQEYRELYEVSRERILNLISDAILLTEVQINLENPVLHGADLATVLERAIQGARPAGRPHNVDIEARSSTTGSVLGDPNLLAKALQALLETAIKFCAPGGTALVTTSADPVNPRITIEACGYSIPAMEIDRFFEIFAIGRTLTPGGDLGLGPALAKCLLTAFGGRVAVETIDPIGVRFTAYLTPWNQEGCP